MLNNRGHYLAGKWLLMLLITFLVLPHPCISAAEEELLQRSLPHDRGFTPREWKPKGQIRGDRQGLIERLREGRTQQGRRPRDARMEVSRELPTVGHARPEILQYINRERPKFHSEGWSIMEAWVNEGFLPTSSEPLDEAIMHYNWENTITEWWEINERSRAQRGGWFRTRFGAVGATPTGSSPAAAPVAK